MTTTDELVTFVPRKGGLIHLVRWSRPDGDWKPQTMIGVYRGCDACSWLVETGGGDLVSVARDDWSPFMP
jgi:hypothetical protein